MRTALSRLVRDTAYTLSAFVLGVVGFVLAVVGTAVGVGLLFTVVGIFVLAATVYAARGLAQLERVRMARMLDADVPSATSRPRRTSTAGTATAGCVVRRRRCATRSPGSTCSGRRSASSPARSSSRSPWRGGRWPPAA